MTTFAIDLSKLINLAHERVGLSKAGLRELFTRLEAGESKPLVKVALELFRNFVAFERGNTRQQVLGVIKERIWPLMDSEEKSELFSKIVKEFLSGPRSGFSQKSIIDAIDTIGVPSGDLIQFLSQTLGLSDGVQQDSAAQDQGSVDKPLIMISSILILSLKQLQRAEVLEATESPSGAF